MTIEIEDYGSLGVLVECSPDDEYTYYRCESLVCGLFYLRCKDGLCNIFVVNNDRVGEWSEKTYNKSDMRNKETCEVTEVKKSERFLLPTKDQYYEGNHK